MTRPAIYACAWSALLACGGAPPPAQPSNTAPAPVEIAASLRSIDPDHGDPDGGTFTRLRGKGFLDGGGHPTKVMFGGEAGTIVRIVSNDELIVQAPGGTPGNSVDVTVVFEPGGERTLSAAFHYTAPRKPY